MDPVFVALPKNLRRIFDATLTWTIGVRSLGLEMKLDSHLLRLRLVTSMSVGLLLLLLPMSQSILIVSLCAKRPWLNGDNRGCVGINEAGEGVVG